MRAGFLKACGTAAVAILLGACSSSPPRGDWEADSPLRIGVLVSTTGPVAFAGLAQRNTVEMLAERLNADGGVDGRPVELLVRDTAADPGTALVSARELIALGAVGIIGPSTSRETMAIRNLCQASRIPLVSCGSSADIVSPVLSYVFKSAPDHRIGYDKLGAELARRNLKRVGIAAPGPVDEVLLDYLRKHGIAVAFQDRYGAEETELSGFFATLKTDSIQALLIWSYGVNDAIAIKGARKAGIRIPIVANESFGDLYHVHAAGEAGDGVIFPAILLSAGTALADSDPRKAVILRFADDYRFRFGQEPAPYAAHMHDAFMLLVHAIGEAGGDRGAIRSALENTRGLFGAGGEFSLSPRDHCGLGADSIEVLAVRNGAFVLAGEAGRPAGGGPGAFRYLPTAAILDLSLRGIDPADGRIYVEQLTGALAGTGLYHVLDTGRRDQYLGEIEWSMSAAADSGEQLKVGRLLAARYIVTGSLGRIGAKYYLDLRLSETESTRIISTVQATYTSLEELMDQRLACIRTLVGKQ